MRAVAFHLLIGGDGTENNFGELSTFEGPVGNTSKKILVRVFINSHE